jgi:hypothetical protein
MLHFAPSYGVNEGVGDTMATRPEAFQTIRTEGAILPPDILRRIVAQDRVEGLTADAYHVPPGTKINEAISQSWETLVRHWHGFQEARERVPEGDRTATAITNERWVLPLFSELGYGRLVTTKSPVIDERVYPVERFYHHTPVHCVGYKVPLDRRTEGVRGAASASPHSMIQELLNCSDDHLWAFLTNGRQLRVMRDNVSLSRQAFVEFDLESMMEGEVYADFALLWLLCHQSRVESETAAECWLEQWGQLARAEGTRVLDQLREGVTTTIAVLGRGFLGHPRNDGLRAKLSSGALTTAGFYQQLLRVVYRLLFLFVAEDRALLHPRAASADACALYDTHYSTRRLRDRALKLRGSKHADQWHALTLVFEMLGRDDGCAELGLCGLGSFLWRDESTADLIGPRPPASGATDTDTADPVFITNEALLEAVRALAYTEQDRVLRAVDYRNLGSEELGSVYESLLELHPVVHAEAKAFDLDVAAGNARKTTGSYYTPDALVQCLLDSALDPVVEDRLQGKTGTAAEEALLNITVCDPACGSGHFLIAAAHRLARHLARIRSGESEPGPGEYQPALRDVMGRCVYGVDLNPMAVELCKFSLWVEAMEPGKPLSFLDHHIQCGNALLGTTPALMARGIPTEAFTPIEGDDKGVAKWLRTRNRDERKGQSTMFGLLADEASGNDLGAVTTAVARLEAATDDTVGAVREKERDWERLTQLPTFTEAQFRADAWCATFVWPKQSNADGDAAITHDTWRRLEQDVSAAGPVTTQMVSDLAREYQFLHWHLAFPQVFGAPTTTCDDDDTTGWTGGFDVMLGNPPWERVKLQEKEWFSERSPEIAAAPTAAVRRRMIKALKTESPTLYQNFLQAQSNAAGVSQLLRRSGRYPLCGRGDINTYTVFAEGLRTLVSERGLVGAVLPSGIATDDTTKVFFQDLLDKKSLRYLFDFENRKGVFPDVHSGMKFCLLTMGLPLTGMADASEFVFFAHTVDDLRDPERRIDLTRDDVTLLNPNTRTSPIFRTRAAAELTKAIYRRVPVLIREAQDDKAQTNPWGIHFDRMFDMANDSALFRMSGELESEGWTRHGNTFQKAGERAVPLYEAKMSQFWNHRAASVMKSATATVRQNQAVALTLADLQDPTCLAQPLYWVAEDEVDRRLAKSGGYGNAVVYSTNVTSATNARTYVTAILPKASYGHSVLLLRVANDSGAGEKVALLEGVLSSFVFDFCARQKLGGINMAFFIQKQLPVLTPSTFSEKMLGRQDSPLSWKDWLLPRILELSYTAWDLAAWAQEIHSPGAPFRWDEKRRALLRAELDAALFHLYLQADANGNWKSTGAESPEESTRLKHCFPKPRDAVNYIMETFPIVKRKDEAVHGDYRTKLQILEIYDAMQQAIDTGEPYQTLLDPPPADPRAAHPESSRPDWAVKES